MKWKIHYHNSLIFLIDGWKNHEKKHFVIIHLRKRTTQESFMNMGQNHMFLVGTLVLTTCATGMLCAAIMTDHWEEVTWDRDDLEMLANSTVRLQWLLDNTVARVSTNDLKDRSIAFLVPMHGGIWTLCVSLNGNNNKMKPHNSIIIFQLKNCPSWAKLVSLQCNPASIICRVV